MGKKKKIILFVSLGVALIAAGLVLFFVLRDNGYRLLKVYEVEGDANVVREKIGDITPYNNMVLENGDLVSLIKGEMCLKADEDKYIYLEDGTTLKLNATGSSEKSKTVIELQSGAITNDIRNKLSEGSSYEVNTPNSTMSVRGTMFRVAVYEENGVKYTKVSVFEGTVSTRLIYKDGTVASESVDIEKGKEVIIYEDGTTVDYVSSTPTDIDFSQIPESVINVVKDAQQDGRDVALGDPEGSAVVTFMYNGAVFGTQTVKKGEKAERPSLKPALTGDWDYDFDEPVTDDIIVEWK
jgi:hypothetical protein